MGRKDLNNKPLVEAVVELRWGPPVPQPTMEVDQYYPLLLGRFSERVQKEYPFHEPLPSSQLPIMPLPVMVQHRFRVGFNKWPVLQIGPGIMTLNEAGGYKWPDFRSRTEEAIKMLFDAHPAPKNFKIREMRLRYLNGVEFDYSKENIFEFLRDKMGTTISLPNSLFDHDPKINPKPSNFNWRSTFRTENPAGSIVLSFSTGKRNGIPSLIWETLVISNADQFTGIDTRFPEWLESAHDIIYEWFFKLIEGELERRFS
jgi:uncharacterized protein (TIGR04255 family)